MGSSNKKKDKDDKEKCFIEPSASCETDSVSKKAKKHKHKRLKERSKREKAKSSVASPDLDEDIEMGDSSQQGQHHLDGFLPSYSADSLGTWEESDSAQLSSVIKTKKSKKKDKNKDRDLLKASRKDKKNSKKDGKPDSEGKIERKDARPEKKNAGKDDGTDSEEERWLHAIEAGKLEEVDDELKRIRNPRLLTARQRALLEKQRPGDPTDPSLILLPGEDVPQQQQQLLHQQEAEQQCQIIIPAEPLLALPSGVREKQVTQEMLEKKAIKSQRRRAQALEKREEDKKKTVDRLLKKQDPKLLKACFAKKSVKSEVLMFSYRSTCEGALLSLPTGVNYPIALQQPPVIPKPKLCGIPGCINPKRYSCSKSGVPLCSLQCYKVNKARIDMLPQPLVVVTPVC